VDRVGKEFSKYHIIGTIWVGQSCVVYRARDAYSRIVALKMLLPTEKGRRHVSELLREARIAMRLDHPRIVRATGYITDGPMPAMVMEYFESEHLKSRIRRSDPLIREKAQEILVQACEGLAYLHSQGLVHRDVKPENVLVAPDAAVKLIDFALAERIKSGLLSFFRRRRIAGTRAYIAPETILRKQPDARTDIYSLGALAFEMLAGHPPFASSDENEILRKHLYEPIPRLRTADRTVSVRMDELVREMLSKAPEGRPASMEEVIRRLQEIRVFDK